ncbi:MAG: hypothetical protein QXP38_13540, partial [Nitrososphaerota archaeon]
PMVKLKSYVSFIGEGWNTVLECTGKFIGLRLETVEWVTIAGLLFRGIKASDSQPVILIGRNTGTGATDSHNITLFNVKVEGGLDAIQVIDTMKYRFYKVWTIGAYRNGIWCWASGTPNYLYGIFLDVESTDNGGYGIHVENVRDMQRVLYCHLINNGDSGLRFKDCYDRGFDHSLRL